MIRADVCSDYLHSDFCVLFTSEMILAVAALIINVLVTLFAFTCERFSPHTVMMRVLLLSDVFMSMGYLMDSYTPLSDSETIQPIPDNQLVTVATCAMSRPSLLLIQISRQWSSILVFIMGIERYLFIAYPLWFKVVRVRRFPIIIFTTFFVTLSSGIAYTNALAVAPDELTHFTCEVTWAFGDNYGCCHCATVIIPMTAGWLLNFYAYWQTKDFKALLKFGNNHMKINGEKRKIRKAMWILSAAVIPVVIPQCGIVFLRLVDKFGLQYGKMVFSEAFLLKFIGNIVLFLKLSKYRYGITACTMKCLAVTSSKNRVDHNDSIASVTYYVN